MMEIFVSIWDIFNQTLTFRFTYYLGRFFSAWLVRKIFRSIHNNLVFMTMEFDLLTSFSWRKNIFINFLNFKVFDYFSSIINSRFSPESLLCWHLIKIIDRIFVDSGSSDRTFYWELFWIFLVKTRLSQLVLWVNWLDLLNLHISYDFFESCYFFF